MSKNLPTNCTHFGCKGMKKFSTMRNLKAYSILSQNEGSFYPNTIRFLHDSVKGICILESDFYCVQYIFFYDLPSSKHQTHTTTYCLSGNYNKKDVPNLIQNTEDLMMMNVLLPLIFPVTAGHPPKQKKNTLKIKIHTVLFEI